MPSQTPEKNREYRERFAEKEKVHVEEKQCRSCLMTKSRDQFYKMAASSDGLQSYCIPCNKERRRGAHIMAHGLTLEQFDAMLREQDGKCAICKQPPVRQGNVTWVIDHDHRCCPGQTSCGGCVRGLLCNPCNRGLGLLGDSQTRLMAAVMYLSPRPTGGGC